MVMMLSISVIRTGNRYPAEYVASYVLNVTTVPFQIKFTRAFLSQGFRLFCYQFVE